MHIYKKLTLAAFCLLFATMAGAQNEDAVNTFTPYTFYGVGDLASPGLSYHRGMGGIGIGMRNNRTINYLNPAALSAQDTLSFMFDFGGEMQNYYLSTTAQSSANNSFNMHHLVMSFPLWGKMVMGLSVLPYSNIGYDINQKETRPEVLVESGDVTYSHQGEGGLTQLMMSLGYSIGRFAVGGQAQYIFGSIDRFDNVDFANTTGVSRVNSGKLIKASNFAFALGAQYTQPLGKYSLTAGAVYQFRNNMKVEKIDFIYSIGGLGTDTLRYDRNQNARLLVPSSLGLGVTLSEGSKWLVGLDYTYRDWTQAEFDVPASRSFKAMPEHIIRAGFEYTPNRYDIRYFLKRWSYRGGLFFENTYLQFDATRIKNYGLTLGVGIPIGNMNNSVNIAAELGQRGTTRNDLIRERYWKVSVSVSLYDIWFIKQRFE
jgi:opacity protein-like surface antigen